MLHFDTTSNFISNRSTTSAPSVNDIIKTYGYSSTGGAGGARWKATGNVIAVSQDPLALNDIKLSDASGNEYELVLEEAGIIDLNVLGGTSAGYENIANTAGLTFSQGLTSDISNDLVNVDTAANLIARAGVSVGEAFVVADRASSVFDAKTGLTANGFDILQSSVDAGIQYEYREEYPINVKSFGVTGDGATDESTATQAVADYIAAKGGAAIFPTPGIYAYGSQVNWTSDHAISIKSDMGADNTASPESCIRPLNAIVGSIFNISSRGASIKGLWFRDTTGTIGVSQGTYSVDAALNLEIFGMGVVDQCYFDQILGTGLNVENMIRGNLTKVHMRDCGTPTLPASLLNTAISLNPGQAVLTDWHLETCYGTYLQLGSNAHNTKITQCHFESDDNISATFNPYLQSDGGFTIVSDCSFNQQGGKYVILNGARNKISNCEFLALSGAVSLARLEINSSFNQVSNCLFNGTASDTGTVIDDINGNTSLSNCLINAGGNVKLGPDSTWTGGKIWDANTAEAYCMVMSAESSVVGLRIDDAATAGGISSTTRCTVSGNSVRGCAGIGIFNNSSTATIVGNSSSNNIGGDWSFSGYPKAYNANNNYASDATLPLTASTTWNPGSLNDGDSESLNIAVTGSEIGDTVLIGFPARASSAAVDGIQVSGSAYTNGTVKATVTNNSGGIVDLDSNTVTVTVLKS